MPKKKDKSGGGGSNATTPQRKLSDDYSPTPTSPSNHVNPGDSYLLKARQPNDQPIEHCHRTKDPAIGIHILRIIVYRQPHYAKRSGAIWRQGSELLSVHIQDEAMPEGGQATNGTRYPHLPETIYCRRP